MTANTSDSVIETVDLSTFADTAALPGSVFMHEGDLVSDLSLKKKQVPNMNQTVVIKGSLKDGSRIFADNCSLIIVTEAIEDGAQINTTEGKDTLIAATQIGEAVIDGPNSLLARLLADTFNNTPFAHGLLLKIPNPAALLGACLQEIPNHDSVEDALLQTMAKTQGTTLEEIGTDTASRDRLCAQYKQYAQTVYWNARQSPPRRGGTGHPREQLETFSI